MGRLATATVTADFVTASAVDVLVDKTATGQGKLDTGAIAPAAAARSVSVKWGGQYQNSAAGGGAVFTLQFSDNAGANWTTLYVGADIAPTANFSQPDWFERDDVIPGGVTRRYRVLVRATSGNATLYATAPNVWVLKVELTA